MLTGCGPPPHIEFADLTTLQKSYYINGERVEYRCQQYYTIWSLYGKPFKTCAQGTWNGSVKCLSKYSLLKRWLVVAPWIFHLHTIEPIVLTGMLLWLRGHRKEFHIWECWNFKQHVLWHSVNIECVLITISCSIEFLNQKVLINFL